MEQVAPVAMLAMARGGPSQGHASHHRRYRQRSRPPHSSADLPPRVERVAQCGSIEVFQVPSDRQAALPEAWWHDSGEFRAAGYRRPDNFYVASEADKMVESLTRAFRRIAQDTSGSAASLAANTTRREVGAMIYQARFQSPSWRGELSAYRWDPATGAFSVEPAWNAGDRLSAMPWARRKIHVHNRQAAANLRYQPLTWNALGPGQRSARGRP